MLLSPPKPRQQFEARYEAKSREESSLFKCSALNASLFARSVELDAAGIQVVWWGSCGGDAGDAKGACDASLPRAQGHRADLDR